ncbi:MAG: hypothetical protein WCL49_13155, partial [bacterium]
MPAQPFGTSDGLAEGFPAPLQGKCVGVHAPGKSDAVALDANGLEAGGGLGSCEVPGLAGAEGKSNALDIPVHFVRNPRDDNPVKSA